jgi:CRISPR system Cascade subunit CasC
MSVPRTFVDIHVIQTVPPSNLNRDDAGSPKHAIFGGVRRARVSSQAWKRAARVAMAEGQPTGNRATRTKRIASMVADSLVRRSGAEPETAKRLALAVVSESKITMDKNKPTETSYLMFFGQSQVDALADLISERFDELNALDDKALPSAAGRLDVVGVLGKGHPADVALFGRMVADLAQLNVDAATQVAHAISTHAVEIEFDYFTAVDDENLAEETGAGMIGTVEFNSATLYRFATVAVHQLAENLSDRSAIAPAIRSFLEAFVRSMPSGKQNSFAARTRPAMVLVVVREDQPVSLATAFEAPVRSLNGVESASAVRLAEEYATATEMWGDRPAFAGASFHAVTGEAGEHIQNTVGPCLTVSALIDSVMEAVDARLGEPVTS